NLVADMRSLYWMRQAGYRVIFDATHSVQRPGGAGDSTSGDGVLAPVLARAAMAAGCDGIFMEVHENPSRALSDGPNQIPLSDLPKHLRMLKAIHASVSSWPLHVMGFAGMASIDRAVCFGSCASSVRSVKRAHT